MRDVDVDDPGSGPSKRIERAVESPMDIVIERVQEIASRQSEMDSPGWG
jgi:hypothetical protein